MKAQHLATLHFFLRYDEEGKELMVEVENRKMHYDLLARIASLIVEEEKDGQTIQKFVDSEVEFTTKEKEYLLKILERKVPASTLVSVVELEGILNK